MTGSPYPYRVVSWVGSTMASVLAWATSIQDSRRGKTSEPKVRRNRITLRIRQFQPRLSADPRPSQAHAGYRTKLWESGQADELALNHPYDIDLND